MSSRFPSSTRTFRATERALRATVAGAALLASALVANAGTITGRVVDDETQLALGGARVRIEGTALETYADRFGRFAIANIPAGPVQVRFEGIRPTWPQTGSACSAIARTVASEPEQ